MHTTKLIAAGVAAVAVTGGVAAAATGNLPTQSDEGRVTAEEHTGFDVPTSREDHPTRDDHPGGAPEPVVVEVDAASAPEDTHGAAVSAVATDDSTSGADHGEAVASVASTNAAATELPDQAATPGTVPEEAADQGDDGAAHAEGRGRP